MGKCLAFMALAAVWSAPALAGDLVVEVTGVSDAGGEVGCGLFSDVAAFPMGAADQQIWLPAATRGVTCRFEALPPGAYAVAVAHDTNGNRKTDTNFVGMPTEAWGVTNAVRHRFRAPTFDEARIEVPDAGATVTVSIAQ